MQRRRSVVDGDACMIARSSGGMLSSGVLVPDSRFSGTATRMYSRPNWGMVRAIVARKIPIAVAKKR